MISKRDILFPYDNIRKTQDVLIKEVKNAIEDKKHLIVHAPTGIGKTIATLGPSLSFALKNDLTVFFLTPRHTQHIIAVDTLKLIKKRFNINLVVVDLIGKRWMCPIPNISNLTSTEFKEYCKSVKEEYKCEYYLKTRTREGKLTVNARKTIQELNFITPLHVEELIDYCRNKGLCPYEIALTVSKNSNVIIGDYNHIFDPIVRNNFLARINKSLKKAIIIVDEAHNLPVRIRDLLSTKLTTNSIKRAIKEAKRYNYNDTKVQLQHLLTILNELASDIKECMEKLLTKEEFINKINDIEDYDQILTDFCFIGSEIRRTQKRSYIGRIALFLDNWLGEDIGYARILSKTKNGIELLYRCLDPSIITKEVIDSSYSVILMSGTLVPTAMYRDLLGVENVIEVAYKNPFPKRNKLCLIIPETTTKFSRRTEQEYKKIAIHCTKLVNLIPGNSIIFFPSYELMNKVNNYFRLFCKKIILTEKQNMKKEEKSLLLEKFKSYKNKGAVLLGVAAGNFGEGIDLPGDFLKAVIIVGIPLQKPNLETKKLINYYEEKFGKGWEYGYIYPAITKCLQNAGRCIRSETDKGVIIFLDERFSWSNYYKCFPLDMNVKVTKLYERLVKEFFSKDTN